MTADGTPDMLYAGCQDEMIRVLVEAETAGEAEV